MSCQDAAFGVAKGSILCRCSYLPGGFFNVILLVERCGNSKIEMFVYAGNVKIMRFATDKIVSEKSKTAE